MFQAELPARRAKGRGADGRPESRIEGVCMCVSPPFGLTVTHHVVTILRARCDIYT